jgi:hypothetical protein
LQVLWRTFIQSIHTNDDLHRKVRASNRKKRTQKKPQSHPTRQSERTKTYQLKDIEELQRLLVERDAEIDELCKLLDASPN